MAGLRVLHVAEAFGGGLLEVVRCVSEHAAAGGQEVAIAHGRRPETPADVRASIDPSVDVFDLSWSRGDAGSNFAAARRLRELQDTWQPDVIHLHSSFAGAVGALALGRRVPLVFTPHAFASAMPGRPAHQRRAFEALERLIVRRSTVVGAVSHSEARVARKLGARNVAIVPNGIAELDPVRLATQAPALKSTPPRVVAVGRLVGQRRPDACARILGAIADVAEVRWLGGGGNEGAWGAAARRTLADAGVEVTGWLPRARLLDELEAATAYLHWTEWDGLPLSVLEAMATDTITVASDAEPNREILSPRQIAATEDDAAALLRRIVTEPATASGVLAAQRARRARYSCRAMVSQWLKLYYDVAGRTEPVAVPSRRQRAVERSRTAA